MEPAKYGRLHHDSSQAADTVSAAKPAAEGRIVSLSTASATWLAGGSWNGAMGPRWSIGFRMPRNRRPGRRLIGRSAITGGSRKIVLTDASQLTRLRASSPDRRGLRATPSPTNRRALPPAVVVTGG
jgi:hypothetical protein